MEKNPTFTHVVAGALRRSDGRWLMHKRPLDKHHGGLWEFPGGKVEVSEKPTEALVRELQEELDIVASVHSTNPAAVAQEQDEDGTRPIVLELYIVDDWEGDPRAMEGGAIGWFAPEKASQLDLAPLDIELAEKLFANLPR